MLRRLPNVTGDSGQVRGGKRGGGGARGVLCVYGGRFELKRVGRPGTREKGGKGGSAVPLREVAIFCGVSVGGGVCHPPICLVGVCRAKLPIGREASGREV